MKTTFLILLAAASPIFAQSPDVKKAPLLDAPGPGYRQEPHLVEKGPSVLAEERTPDFGMTGIKLCGPGDFRAIADVLPDTPASKAGIQAGDYIVAVDGADTKDLQLEELASLIRGEPMLPVTITLKRKDTGEVAKVTLTRVSYHDYRDNHKSCTLSRSQQPQASTESKRPDVSALPEQFTSKLIHSEIAEGLIHETILFKDADKTVMLRSVWLTPDRAKIVRSGHIVSVNGTEALNIVDMREDFEHHSTEILTLPDGIRLTISEADALSPTQWKFHDGHRKILACFTRDPSGLIRPMTKPEYEAMLDERIKKLSTK